MEFDEDKDKETGAPYTDGDFVEIYSKRAIFWFAVFSPLYASVLFIINLWVAGYKWVISQVILFLLFNYLLLSFVIRALNIKIDPEALKKLASGNPPVTSFSQIAPFLELFGLTIVFNVLAAFFLTGFFFRKYFPDDDYYPRSVWRPLLIYILLTLVLGGRGF